MTIVVDTSAVLASKDESDPAHRPIADILLDTAEELIVSPFVVAECDYILATRLGPAAAREFLGEVADEAYTLAELDGTDVAAAIGVIDQYADLHLGIADASLVVLAARYRTDRLLTLDERHFRAVAPRRGGTAFTLLPADG